MKKITKLVALLLALLCLGSVAGCKPADIAVTEEELREVLSELLPAAEELNVIYYGEGLPTREGGEGAVYLELAEDAKYKTADELKNATYAVFSDEMAGQMYAMGVQGYYDDDAEVLGDSLGFDMGIDSRYTEMLGIFCMRASKKEPVADLGRVYDLDTLKIVDLGAEFVTVSIMSENNGEELEITLTLVTARSQKDMAASEFNFETNIEGVEITETAPAETTGDSAVSDDVSSPSFWRIDSPTY